MVRIDASFVSGFIVLAQSFVPEQTYHYYNKYILVTRYVSILIFNCEFCHVPVVL